MEENFCISSIGKPRNFLPILLIGAIVQISLNILPIQNLPEQVKDKICLKYYSHRTEKFYIQQIRRYILFHHPHPSIATSRLGLPIFPVQTGQTSVGSIQMT